jgi:enamine deaminase RidA (YjgF/YER057c/UK114 family)
MNLSYKQCCFVTFLINTIFIKVEGQTLNTLKKVEDLLSEAGTSKSELITASIWLKNIEKDFHSMNAIWSGWVDPENKPVRATVEANMARPQILVEIQVTAALRNASD